MVQPPDNQGAVNCDWRRTSSHSLFHSTVAHVCLDSPPIRVAVVPEIGFVNASALMGCFTYGRLVVAAGLAAGPLRFGASILAARTFRVKSLPMASRDFAKGEESTTEVVSSGVNGNMEKRYHNHNRYRAKQEPGAKRRLTIWLAVCVLFFTWAAVQSFHQQGKIADKQAELERVEQQLKDAQRKERELETRIELLHDPDYVSELARKEYYMTKEGEIIIVDPR